MELVYKAALYLHLLGLALGGAASFGHPVLGAIAARTPEARPHMMRAGKALSTLGRAGIALLVASGAIMVWWAYDVTALPPAFWIKMALVVVLVVNVVMAGIAAKRVMAGDATFAARLPVHGKIGVALLLLLVLFAVLAFR